MTTPEPALLDVYAGDELTFEVEVTSDDLAFVPNLLGTTIRFALWRKTNPRLPLLTLQAPATAGQDPVGGIEVLSASAPAVFAVRLSPEATVGLTGKYEVEAKVRFSARRVETVLRGRLKVNPSAIGAMP